MTGAPSFDVGALPADVRAGIRIGPAKVLLHDHDLPAPEDIAEQIVRGPRARSGRRGALRDPGVARAHPCRLRRGGLDRRRPHRARGGRPARAPRRPPPPRPHRRDPAQLRGRAGRRLPGRRRRRGRPAPVALPLAAGRRHPGGRGHRRPVRPSGPVAPGRRGRQPTHAVRRGAGCRRAARPAAPRSTCCCARGAAGRGRSAGWPRAGRRTSACCATSLAEALSSPAGTQVAAVVIGGRLHELPG